VKSAERKKGLTTLAFSAKKEERFMMRKLAIITAFLMFIFVSGLGAATIGINMDFETGSFGPWVQSGDTSFTGVSDVGAHSGTYGAYFGPISGTGYITQTLTTDPGATYNLSFWISNQSGTFFEASWGGAPIYSEGSGDYAWTQRQFTVTASGASTDLRFGFNNVPSYYYLDDVSVEQAIPEPSSMILAGLGMAALLAFRRRR
jgi:hypothetical protein